MSEEPASQSAEKTTGPSGDATELDPVDRLSKRAREHTPTVWALWMMSRPSQLLLIVVVYGLGLAIAAAHGTELAVGAAILGLLALLPVAAAVHYANEYADYETDAVTHRTAFSGGSGALHATGLPRSLAQDATVISLTVGTLVGVLGWLAGVFPTAALALLAVGGVFGLAYSLPPFAFSRRGLGEIDNALLGGFVLPCYGAATLGGLTLEAALAVVPFTLLVFVNLLETQWPDRRADADVGKDTLAVRWRPSRLRAAYWLTTLVAFGTLLWMTRGLVPTVEAIPQPRVFPAVVAYATLPALPAFIWGAVQFTEREAPFPAVTGMVYVAVAQLLAWVYIAV